MARSAYAVDLVGRAFDFLLDLPERPYDRTLETLDILSSNPWYGRVFDPEYGHMAPPVACRRVVVPRTTVELFYYVDEAQRRIKVIYAGDARANPLDKFVGLHPTDLE